MPHEQDNDDCETDVEVTRQYYFVHTIFLGSWIRKNSEGLKSTD